MTLKIANGTDHGSPQGLLGKVQMLFFKVCPLKNESRLMRVVILIRLRVFRRGFNRTQMQQDGKISLLCFYPVILYFSHKFQTLSLRTLRGKLIVIFRIVYRFLLIKYTRLEFGEKSFVSMEDLLCAFVTNRPVDTNNDSNMTEVKSI